MVIYFLFSLSFTSSYFICHQQLAPMKNTTSYFSSWHRIFIDWWLQREPLLELVLSLHNHWLWKCNSYCEAYKTGEVFLKKGLAKGNNIHTCRPLLLLWYKYYNSGESVCCEDWEMAFPTLPSWERITQNPLRNKNHSVTATKSLLPAFLGRPGYNLYSTNMSLFFLYDSCLGWHLNFLAAWARDYF